MSLEEETGMPPVNVNQPNDAITAARFSVTIDGHEIASFSELAGITSEVKPVDSLESTDNEIILKEYPGKPTPPTIVLRRGKNASMDLWVWHEAVLTGAARKNASLVIYNTDGKPVARYHMANAWPAKLEIGALKAGPSEVLMETVTIVCERLQRVAP
jgi:phage tail-like protein